MQTAARGYWHYCRKMWLLYSKAPSPDGLVHDPSTLNSEGLIELKYIQVEEYESLEDALIRKGICKKYEDGVKLNVKNKYYFQIQQVMFVVEKN